jgi:cyclopropane fatty-acyl-phospholipid synthase-like methyltransferase
MSTILPHSDLNTLHDRLAEEIPPGSTVLDVGAGLAKYHQMLIDRGCKLTLVDAHKPYLDERRSRWPQIETINDKAENALWDAEVKSRRWDVVLGIDFVEHLDQRNAQYVIEHMEAVASKVILFVPEGNHPQDKDHYEMGGDHWQTHRSIWQAADLEALGFTVERWLDFHVWAKDRGVDPGALWAAWRRP